MVRQNELYYLSIKEASELISRGDLSPVELMRSHLDRIAETDGHTNSFITLLEETSIEESYLAEKSIASGKYLGPLHGIPIGLKDLCYTKGIRTTIGSQIFQNFTPDYDATVTGKLKSAGAIIVGKLQMHEFAFGPTSTNPHYGNAHNPWDLENVTGGSSGGSASSVASGQLMGSLGSDTGGSIRIPSALCGIVGLKPTFGRVSRYGIYPLSSTLDTVGPMTRNVADSGLMLNAISGYDHQDPSSVDVPTKNFNSMLEDGITSMRIGIPDEYFFDILDPDVRRAFDDAVKILEKLGADINRISVPILERSLSISGPIMMAEAAAVHSMNIRNHPDQIGTDVLDRLQSSSLLPATDYVVAQNARSLFNNELSKIMSEFELLLVPSVPIGAPKFSSVETTIDGAKHETTSLLPRLTRPFNICGLPTITVPCGLSNAGMPLGIQFAGRVFSEDTVLKAAYAFEQATDWHNQHPPI